MKDSAWGFGWGAGTGIVLAFVALLVVDPGFEMTSGDTARASLGQWLDVNLGYSVWLFAIVMTLYVLNLRRLSGLLEGEPALKHIVELDQLSDVWIHLFVGIGVIWTAVGMRSALQSALGDPGQALVDSAGSVLQKLVDGGILLALTTTIVGGVGGYLMRLAKTMVVGASLQDYYDEVSRIDTRELLRSTRRIEARLEALEGGRPVTSGDS
ncbi:MAG: hypothetical protein OES38_06015 [Gammaproteobacteria bacterium]|nr:hypothetical protein [Gammaproteobacteria bacterium]